MYLSDVGQTESLTNCNIIYHQLHFSKEKFEWCNILRPPVNFENVKPVGLYINITFKIVIFKILPIYQINHTLELWKGFKKTCRALMNKENNYLGIYLLWRAGHVNKGTF